MKKKKLFILNLFLLVTMTILSSCSKDDTDFVEINGKFLGGISDCEGVECVDYLQFIGNSQADLAMGDIVHRVFYKLEDRKIYLYWEKDRITKFSFVIKNEKTLVRIEDSTSWIKL